MGVVPDRDTDTDTDSDSATASDSGGAARHPVVVVRHGETEWSRSGRHTSRTDVELTDRGRAQASALRATLTATPKGDAPASEGFALVLTSPARRARDTAAAAGFAAVAQAEPLLVEWDYGDYEGRTTREIRVEHAGWSLWADGVPGGETAAEVAARADAVIARLRALDGVALVFSHGHFLRVLGARWLGLPPDAGRYLALDPASVSTLGWEREQAVLARWNVAG